MKYPETSLTARIARSLTSAEKAAFLTEVILGYTVHLFAFTNIIPNSDGLDRIYDQQQMTVSGRWALHFASMLNGYTQSPALIGFLSVLFLGLAAVLMVRLFHLSSPLSGAVTGALCVVSYAVTYTFLFMFTASAYALGILLAVTSVFAARHMKRGGIPSGAVLLAVSLGIYQSYLGVALSLAVILFILDITEADTKPSEALRFAFRLLFMEGLAVGFYFLVLKIFLSVKHLSLLTYKNADSLGSAAGAAGRLLHLPSVYADFFRYLFVPASSTVTTKAGVLPNILYTAVLIAFLVNRMHALGRSNTKSRILPALAALALLPLALNFTEILAHSTVTTRYAFQVYYLFGIILLDRRPEPERSRFSLWSRKAMLTVLTASLLLTGILSNRLYTQAANAHRATLSFMTTLAARIESTPGYTSGDEVFLIGTPSKSILANTIGAFSSSSSMQSPADSVLYLNKHLYQYLNSWLGIPWEEPSEEAKEAVYESGTFAAMTVYPDDGSIVRESGRIIVKLSNDFTPKADFEIAYEQRH